MAHLAHSRTSIVLCGGLLSALHPVPEWMRGLSYLLPPSYVFESVRATISGSAVSGRALLWSGLLAIAYLLMACSFFVRIYKYAVRTGLFARYSAETLS
jgi:ABC-2 type transport system permease protein